MEQMNYDVLLNKYNDMERAYSAAKEQKLLAEQETACVKGQLRELKKTHNARLALYDALKVELQRQTKAVERLESDHRTLMMVTEDYHLMISTLTTIAAMKGKSNG